MSSPCVKFFLPKISMVRADRLGEGEVLPDREGGAGLLTEDEMRFSATEKQPLEVIV
jgi:hypothetical protein